MSIDENVNKFKDIIENMKLDIGELYTYEPIQFLVSERVQNVVLKRATRRYEKYIAKIRRRRKEEPPLEMKANLSYAFLKKALLEELLRIVLGWYGITGGIFLNYSNFANRIAKICEKTHGKALLDKIEREMKDWIEKYNLNLNLSKIIALVSVKTTRYAQKNYSQIILERKKEEGEENPKRKVDFFV